MGIALKPKALWATGVSVTVITVLGGAIWLTTGEGGSMIEGARQAATANSSIAPAGNKLAESDGAATISAPFSVGPNAGASPDAAQTPSLTGTAASPTDGKPLRKKFSELSPEEQRRYQEGRLRRMNFQRMRIATARTAARDDGACKSGDQKACSRLAESSADGDRRLLLTQVRKELSGACDGKDLNACIHRGDLEIAGADKSSAASWYEKAKAIASDIKTACEAGQEVNPRKCTRARRSLDTINKREQRMAANDAGGGAGAPMNQAGGNIKQPHAPRLPLSKLMEKAKLAPKGKPLPPPGGEPAAAEAPTASP